MLIDTHQHVFWHGRDDKGLVEDLNEHGIDVAWLLSWDMAPDEDNGTYHFALNPIHRRADGTHAGIPLSDLLLAREHYPDRFMVGYCPHPLLPNAPALFEAAHDMHGVRVCGEWKFRVLFDDPRCLELYRAAGALGCPVVLHIDVPFRPDEAGQPVYREDWYGGTVANLERALAACPQTVFIGHASGFWREICGEADSHTATRPNSQVKPGGRLITLFERFPNLYADLSAGSGLNALQRDVDFARSFLIRFSDRLLFGRDYYGGELQQLLNELDLPDAVLKKIFHENALRLVPLSPSMHKPSAPNVPNAPNAPMKPRDSKTPLVPVIAMK